MAQSHVTEPPYDTDTPPAQAGLLAKRWRMLGVAMAVQLLLGTMYAWSIFSVPIGQEMGWPDAALSLTFRINLVAFSIGGIVSSFVKKHCSLRVSFYCGAALLFAGFAGTALFAQWGIGAVYAFYGACSGIGCGFVYNAIVASANVWFPDRVGFASGLLLLAFGMGSLVLGVPIDAAFGHIGWRPVFLVLACVSMLATLTASVFVTVPPDSIAELAGKARKRKTVVQISDVSFSPRQLLSSRLFALSLVWYVCIAMAALTLMGESKQVALQLGIDASVATVLVGAIAACNGVSRIAFGILLDRFGILFHMRLVTGMSLAALVLLSLSFLWGSGIGFACGAIVLGSAYSGLPVYSTTFSLARYGREWYATNYAIAVACIIPASFASMLLSPWLQAQWGNGVMYTVYGVITLAGLAVQLLYSRQFKKDMSALVRKEG